MSTLTFGMTSPLLVTINSNINLGTDFSKSIQDFEL